MANKTFIAALAVTTALAAGAAFAADQPASPPPGHRAVVKDFGKLSADGVRAYQDLSLARLAIFDGRPGDAKKFVADADNGFDRAQGDESVFKKAEAELRTHVVKDAKGSATSAANTSGQSGADQSKTAAADNSAGSDASKSDVETPIAWLPVDGTVSINEDFTLQPAKAKAVADANKSLAKGDRKGAMEKLKVAGVDTAVTLAVVPLKQTIADVKQAEQLIDSGKYYEGSQKLKAVQDSTIFTVSDIPGVPAAANGKAASNTEPATH